MEASPPIESQFARGIKVGKMVVTSSTDPRVATEVDMKRVTGIGGIFFKAKDPKAMAAWYKRHLGIDVQDWGGAAFRWTDSEGKPVAGTTAWLIDPAETDHFAPSRASFMVNYRVADLRALLKALKEEGCNVLDKLDESEYGLFGWVMDPEDNKVELWEPPPGDHALGGESMKNVDLVKSLYDAFGRGDIPSVLGAMSPDIHWHQAEGNPYMPSGEAWVGPDAVLNNLFTRLGAEWDGFVVHTRSFHDAGDTVIVEARYSGTYKPTGKSMDTQVCHVWDVKDGRLTRFQQYVDTAKLHDVMKAR